MDKVKEILGKITGAIKTRWEALNRTIRIIIIAVASVIVVSLIVLIIINSITRYAVLYSGASPEETAEIITVLQGELGETDVRVDNNGDILVPANRLETLRAQLSVKGYPKTTFNYDIWDNGIGMFSTESDKRVKEKQQLQENLRATLAMFDGVESAIVILNIPADNNYVLSVTRDEPSASVVVNTSHTLSVSTVEGIYHLIRTAVKGLKEENITVTDGTGELLTTDKVAKALEEEDETVLYYKRLEFQNNIIKILDDKLGELLKKVFPDYRIGVDVRLNYDPTVKQIKEYTPSVESEGTRGGMVQNEKYVSAGGGNAEEGGLVGTTVNADISPDYPTLRIGEGDEFYYETQKEINYLVNEEITQVEKDGYSFDNISASVIVDGDPENFTQANIEDWQKLIADAIGTSSDKVSFIPTNFTLDRTGESAGDGGVIVQGGNNTLVFIIIALGIMLIVLLVTALIAAGSNKKRMKARRAAAVAASSASSSPLTAANLSSYDEDEMGRRTMRPEDGGDGYEFEIQSLSGEEDETSRDALLKKEIRDFSTSNPEIVAQLIRNWIKGEE
ncbi:MAG: flagellar M-ring protein FliF [Ruminiclostridium sp.]|nr:flagellar M-ring protein FliF [Ruminiclostridium sp.]